MTAISAQLPKFQFFDTFGAPLVNGTLSTYLAGTTTPVTTYRDQALTIANTNPIVLDSRGECMLWLDSTKNYKFVLADSLSVVQWTVDNITNTADMASAVSAALAASGGSSLVGFIQAGAGAVPRTVQSKLQEYISVKDYGAVGNGIADDTAAIQDAINYAATLAAASPNRGAAVDFPPGQYRCTATLTISSSRISLRGRGSFHSQIIRGTNYGPTINILSQTTGTLNILERIEVSGLTLYHDISSAVAMTAPHLQAAGVVHGRFLDLDINNGAYGIYLYGGVDIEIKSCDIIGSFTTGANNGIAGVTLADAAASGYSVGSVVPLPTQILISDTEVFGPLNTGWQYALLINAAEDVTSSNCYYGNSRYYNVYIQQNARNQPILEVAFTNGTYIDGSGADSVRIDGSAGSGAQYIGTVSFDGCDIKGQGGQTPGSGIFVDGTARAGTYAQACRNLRVSGCRIGDYANNGIWLVGCVNSIISANQIGGNNYGNAASGRGILVGSTADRVSIVDNRIGGLPEGGGTSFQVSGIELVSGATNVQVSNNDLRGNVNSLTDGTAAATTTARSNRIYNNVGYNEGRAAASPTMPATGVNQYNPYGSPAMVSVFAGTVSSIKLNGTQVYASTADPTTVMYVGPGDVVNITYTVAPNWIWWPQ